MLIELGNGWKLLVYFEIKLVQLLFQDNITQHKTN